MSLMKDISKPTEVICQFNTDGDIIPIKLKFRDMDGETQTFVVKSYKELHSNDITKCFMCKIVVFDQFRIIKLLFRKSDCHWFAILETG